MKNDKRLPKYLLIGFMFALTLLINSCATTQDDEDLEFKKSMDSWIGYTKKQLILKKGPPTSITSDGDKGEVLVYEDLRRAVISGTYLTVVHRTMFYVNSDGIIYHWRYDRSGRQGF